MSSEDEFELEDVVDCKFERTKFFFLIKWKGFSAADNSWEPEENITQVGQNLTDKIGKLKQKNIDQRSAPRKTKTIEREKLPSTQSKAVVSTGTKKTKRSASIGKPSEETLKVAAVSNVQCKVQTKDDVKDPRVISINRDKDSVMVYIREAEKRKAITVDEAREHYAPELLTYLLARLKFPSNTK